MPRLSDSMEEGTVLSWMKSVGDEVALGDELVEIETDKANMAYESDVAGTLVEILADEGATLPIGEVIARMANRETPATRPRLPRPTPKSPPKSGPRRALQPRHPRRRRTNRPHPPPRRRRRPTASGSRPPPLPGGWPASRESSSRSLTGSGPGGRIVKADVEAAEAGRLPPRRLRAPAAAAASGARRVGRDRPRQRGGVRADAACSRRSPGAWPSRRRPPRTST